jgi:RHS repeat-associated protein
VDNQLQHSEQNGQTVAYTLDPQGRTKEVDSTGNVTAAEEDQYSGPGSSPSWTAEINGQYTRLITGISGGLAAIQHNGEEPVLQLANLHGDIVATAALSPSATGPIGANEASEYGVPGSAAPSRYSWLGFHEIPTQLPSGLTGMGARSYVPQLGRFLQPDPVPGGSINAYAYTFDDPVNEFDFTGALTAGLSAAEQQAFDQVSHEAVEEQIAREEALRREAEERAREAAEAAGLQMEAGEEEWGEEWEEGEEEDVAYHSGEGGQSSPLVEEGLFHGAESAAAGAVGGGGLPPCSVESGGHACAKPVGQPECMTTQCVNDRRHNGQTKGPRKPSPNSQCRSGYFNTRTRKCEEALDPHEFPAEGICANGWWFPPVAVPCGIAGEYDYDSKHGL